MKNSISILIFCFLPFVTFSQIFTQNTSLEIDSSQVLFNNEYAWTVLYQDKSIGTWVPVKGINLVTNQTNPEIFETEMPLDTLQMKLRCVATAPDGMSASANGGYLMQGKGLVNGKPCGDGKAYDYGIIIVRKGFDILFTHKREISNLDSLYNKLKGDSTVTMFFLPSIARTAPNEDTLRVLRSDSKIDKILVRRETFSGVKMGIILFDKLTSYKDVIKIVQGLDRPKVQRKETKNGHTRTWVTWSNTTHAYVMDGGPTWGQSCLNGELIGTRNPAVVTNYIVTY